MVVKNIKLTPLYTTHTQPVVDEEHAAVDDQRGQPSTGHLQTAGLRENSGQADPG